MRLLFDHNLSPRLVPRLSDAYLQAEHVYLIGLDKASDEIVWQYARDNGYTIVTRDVDFSELSVLRGFPPKLIWIRRGNCSTHEIEELLRSHREVVETFGLDPATSILTLF